MQSNLQFVNYTTSSPDIIKHHSHENPRLSTTPPLRKFLVVHVHRLCRVPVEKLARRRVHPRLPRPRAVVHIIVLRVSRINHIPNQKKHAVQLHAPLRHNHFVARHVPIQHRPLAVAHPREIQHLNQCQLFCPIRLLHPPREAVAQQKRPALLLLRMNPRARPVLPHQRLPVVNEHRKLGQHSILIQVVHKVDPLHDLLQLLVLTAPPFLLPQKLPQRRFAFERKPRRLVVPENLRPRRLSNPRDRFYVPLHSRSFIHLTHDSAPRSTGIAFYFIPCTVLQYSTIFALNILHQMILKITNTHTMSETENSTFNALVQALAFTREPNTTDADQHQSLHDDTQYYIQTCQDILFNYYNQSEIQEIIDNIDQKAQRAIDALLLPNELIINKIIDMTKMLYDYEILAVFINKYAQHFPYEKRYYMFATQNQLQIDQDADEAISIAKCVLAQRQIEWVTAGYSYDKSLAYVAIPYNFRELERHQHSQRYKDVNKVIKLLQKPKQFPPQPKISLQKLIQRHNISNTNVQMIAQKFVSNYNRRQNLKTIFFDNQQQSPQNTDSLRTFTLRHTGIFDLIDEDQLSLMLLFISAYYNTYFPCEEARCFLENTFPPTPMYIKHGVSADNCKTIIIPFAMLNLIIEFWGPNRILLNLQTKKSRPQFDKIDKSCQWLKNAVFQYDQILFPFMDREIPTDHSYYQLRDDEGNIQTDDLGRPVYRHSPGHWALIRLLRQPDNSFTVSILDSLRPVVPSWESYLKNREINQISASVKFFIEKIILDGHSFTFSPQPDVPQQINLECGVHTALNIAALCLAGKKQVLSKADFDFDSSTTARARYFFAWHSYAQLVQAQNAANAPE